MFLDGSVMASALAEAPGIRQGTRLYERGDAERFGAAVPLIPSNQCGAPGDTFLIMESGQLNLYACQGSPSAHALDETMDVDTECPGHNKQLFD
jgi:hypothetical protein